MSIIAAALRELIAAGVTGEALVSAVERIEAAQSPTRTARQARNARYYEAHKDHIKAKASEKRLNASEASCSVASAPSPKTKVPGPLKTQPLTPKNEEGKRGRRMAFPADFEPNETDKRVAAEVGCADLPAEVEHFRDHHVSKNNVFADWHAALRTWLRSPLRVRRPARAPPVSGHRSTETLPFPSRQDRQHVQTARGSAAQLLRAELEEELADMRAGESEGLFAQPLRLVSVQ